ncbi:hypothetical protein AAG906_032892 [Vitis piasezkii]
MTHYFPDEVDEHKTFAEIKDIMLAMSMSLIDGTIKLELVSPFDLFKVSAIEIAEEIQIAPASELLENAIFVDDLFEGTIGPVEGASDFIDSPLSFDVLSRFVSRSDNVEEIQKQLGVGFLLMVEYPEWLAKVVYVPKKDDKVRVCVDF